MRTPTPSTPEAVLQACAQIDRELGARGPVGLAFPSVVQGGIARTAANVDKSWIGCAGGARLSQLIGRPVIFLNDADAAGVAEMSTGGAGRDMRGVVMLLTFGTGIGSALFLDGELVPNTELGHMEFHGQDAELIGLGPGAHRGAAGLGRAGARASTIIWRGCMRCSGPICSSSAARSARTSTSSGIC